jgi:uncharacterized NAD(P)/FAD-binding protein YdhS
VSDEEVPGLLPAAQEVVAVARRTVPILRKNHEFTIARELKDALDTYTASKERLVSAARQIREENAAREDRKARRFG